MENAFKKAEETYSRLKERFRRQEISRQEFLDEMKNIQVRDDQARLWMIGNQSGKWYFLKDKEWVQSDPPVEKKEPRPICPYCGLENKPDALVCARCGGNVRLAADICPQCGSTLQPPLYRCPVCDVPESQAEAVRKTESAPTPISFSEPDKEKKEKKEKIKESAPGVAVARSLDALSFFFFGGATGIVVGIVLGAFAGSTRFLSWWAAVLPVFLKDMQGTLLGAVVYAAAGGVAGFLALGAAFFLMAVFVNLILSFVGGVKIRLDISGGKS
ncbi:MAG: zinc ribbon domain-containing protein [Candidatus Aminicenantes bacterium]|nr:zinc ribbon domain-containing protein [Candidatus Aminicenantes bacterium]